MNFSIEYEGLKIAIEEYRKRLRDWDRKNKKKNTWKVFQYKSIGL